MAAEFERVVLLDKQNIQHDVIYNEINVTFSNSLIIGPTNWE